MDLVLDIKDLVVHYETEDSDVHAVNGIDIAIGKKRTLGLVGETGAGKTTTALSIMNLVPDPPGVIKSGSIMLEGRDVLKMSDAELEAMRGNDVAMIFQDPMTALNPVMTVGNQIIETLRAHEKMPRKAAYEAAVKMLMDVGMPEPEKRMKAFPHQLSGGMRQRVMIALALACRPEVLIADEPTTALDVTIQAQILKLMRDLKEKTGTSIILITHDLGVVAEMADDIAVMYAGEIVEQGSTKDIFESPMHPYTQGLMKSIPRLDIDQDKLYTIRGTVPDLSNMPEGCRFCDRCEFATLRCKREKPELLLHGSHFVRCFRKEVK